MKKINLVCLAVIMVAVISCKDKTKKLEMIDNPLLEQWNTAYEIPPFEKIKLEHYLPAFHEGMKLQNAEIDAIVNNQEAANFKNTIEAIEYSGKKLNDVAAVFFNLLETNSDAEMQKIADSISPLLSVHGDNINLNPELFKRVKTVYDNRANENLNDEQMKLLEETYKSFVRGGANLPEDKKDRFKEVNQEMSQLALKFNSNVLDATNAFTLEITDEKDLAGLPVDFIESAKQTDDAGKTKWVFTLDNPSLLPFLTYADNRDLREKIWRAYSTRCNAGDFDNNEIINKMVNLRLERANLLGYKSHADFVLEDCMAKTPEAVYELLMAVWNPAIEKAKKERDTYKDLSKLPQIQPWDWRYYEEKTRVRDYNLNSDSISQYFPVENVKQAIFTVCEKLYGITFRENKDLPKYHEDVASFEVVDNNEVIAILFMDYYVRPSKSSGAWMTEFRTQHQTVDGTNVIPLVSLVLNFPKPVGDKPALLSFDDTETFFHEFGHALHGMLSKCRYASIAGTNTPRDFVEFPSQFMENYAFNPEFLKTYAKHYKTGDVIPDKFIDQILKVRSFGQGFTNVELIAASLLDMDYHTITETTVINPSAFEDNAMNKIGLIPEIISRYKSQYFKHIFTSSFGYSSGYYAYTWTAVIEADAFELFKEKGIFDKETATSLRQNILQVGNTKDLMNQYLIFRGQEPSIEPLLKKRGLE